MRIFNQTSLKPAWIVAGLDPPRLSATWVVKGTFRLTACGTATAMEEGDFPTGDQFFDDDPDRGLKYDGDFAPYKPRTDVMLVGTCYAPGGKPAAACRVSLGVAGWRKTLVAVGDRAWLRGPLGESISDPVPFTSIPVRLQRAYGGPGFARNPLGRGHRLDVLPNFEDPKRRITSSSTEFEPASFAPLPRTWPQRTSRLGTYTGTWLRERWPWFPHDFDWGHFNAAPLDQQFEGYLRGDEPVELENLHSVHARYETRLPGIRPQVFVVDGYGVREVPLRLDTLWVDADEEKLVLVWRGALAIQSIKLADLREVHLVQTRLEERPAAWEDLTRETQRKAAAVERAKAEAEAAEAAEEAEFAAAMARLEEDAAVAVKAAESEAEKAAAALSAQLQADGLPPVPPLGTPVAPAPLSSLAASLHTTAAADPDVAALVAQLPSIDIPEDEDLTPDEPWTRNRCSEHAARGGSFAEQDLSGLDLSGLDFSGSDFEGAVLTGAKLTASRVAGCNFGRADLSEAVMEGADATQANFTRADLTGAQLSRASLDGACLERTTLTGAALVEASLVNVRGDRADFNGANLAGAVLQRGHFFKADFSGAALENADFSNAHLEHAMVEAARGPEATFAGADVRSLHAGNGASFPGANFSGCQGDGSYWEGAVLDATDFSDAVLPHADFSSASLKAARFDRANLAAAVLDDAKADGALFRAVNLFRASMQRASLRGADIRVSNLYEADVWNAVLEGGRLEGANVRMTKLATP